MLSVRQAARVIQFYRAAGAVEPHHVEDPGGAIVARLSVNGADFWIADESPAHGNVSPQDSTCAAVRLVLTVPDPDAVFAQAIATGARSIASMIDQEYGWRVGRLVDPFRHHWEVGRPLAVLEMVSLRVTTGDPPKI